ncbi:MAG: hypothetical protein JWO54_8 [Candidatus Saccharibacteria bacterium]|nr:hypothetical protein [Candidatus Saccharibacteria bacterium]MDB5180250.1 hypothetical protein [Candidatus Saccharibacteria bacterium]
MAKIVEKLKKNAKKGNEQGARRAVLEDLFYDFNSSKAEVYKMNFFRGIFLGFGTVIGGTLVVALIVWILTLLADIPGGTGDFIQYIVDTVQDSSK